jgi:hypothetical protein
MMQFHHYTLADLENMIPWQRQIYMDMLEGVVKSENERQRDAIVAQQNAMREQGKMRPAAQTDPRVGVRKS